MNEEVKFAKDAVVGSIGQPAALTLAYEEMEQVIAIDKGWNWISFSVLPLGGEVADVFSGYTAQDNDLIKGPGGMATSFQGEWFPPNYEIEPGKMYMLRRQEDGKAQVRVQGGAQSTSTEIPLSSGWNWFGYIPQEKLGVKTALAQLKANNGDIIKSQNFGTLTRKDGKWLPEGKTMEPGRGYMLLVKTPQTFRYDKQSGGETNPPPQTKTEGRASSMVVYAKVSLNGKAAEVAGSKLEALQGADIVGMSEIGAGPDGSMVYQLLVQSNSASGTKINFQLRAGGAPVAINETVNLMPDGVTGSLNNPLKLTGTKPSSAAPPKPKISGKISVSGKVGSAFSYRITASNKPTEYKAEKLPTGLSLNKKTGVITGKPQKAGTYKVKISAANASGTTSATLTINCYRK